MSEEKSTANTENISRDDLKRIWNDFASAYYGKEEYDFDKLEELGKTVSLNCLELDKLDFLSKVALGYFDYLIYIYNLLDHFRGFQDKKYCSICAYKELIHEIIRWDRIGRKLRLENPKHIDHAIKNPNVRDVVRGYRHENPHSFDNDKVVLTFVPGEDL